MWIKRKNNGVFRFPKSVQKTIPILAWHPNGIFEHNREYSMSCQFSDIEYAAADEDTQEDVIMQYKDILKSIDTDCLTKITIINRKAEAGVFKEALSLPDQNDMLDCYRHEINKMNQDRAEKGNNRILQDRYITISVPRRSVDEAKILFNRVEGNLKSYFKALGSECVRLSTLERARVLHDFFKPGQSQFFHPDFEEERHLGQNIKPYLCPAGMTFPINNNYFTIEGRYGRALFIQTFPAMLSDLIVADLMTLSKEMALSIDLITKSREEARKMVERKLLDVNTERANSTAKANKMGNWGAEPPFRTAEDKREYEELLYDINSRDERLILTQITIVHIAESIEELDNDTQTLIATGRRHDCQIEPLWFQQEAGLNTALPYGLRYTQTIRTLKSECAAMLMPFNTQEIWDRNGICYGVNQISGNLVVSDRGELMNGNAFILAVSGGGKSMLAKSEFISAFLKYMEDDFIIIDPQGEYRKLVEMFMGTSIDISASSKDHVNVMDMYNSFSGKDDPVRIKSQFLLSLAEQFMGNQIGRKDQSIIDRCVRNLLMQQKECTLLDLYDLLLEQKEPEAREIALNFEMFVTGSLNTFAHKTNVNLNNRLVCFDIKELSDQMKPVGMLVVMDAILSRVAKNKAMGKRTWVYFDEMHLMFGNPYTAELMDSFWKLVRKYGGFMTGITQNVSDVMKSEHACNMLANSEIVLMLNQAKQDRETLEKLLSLSKTQVAHITNSPKGFGLMRRGSAVVPINTLFDKNTRLYRAMTTKMEEVAQFEEEDRLAGEREKA